MFEKFKERKRFKLAEKCFDQLIENGTPFEFSNGGGSTFALVNKDMKIIFTEATHDRLANRKLIELLKNDTKCMVFEREDYCFDKKAVKFIDDGKWLDLLIAYIKLTSDV